MLVKLNRSNLSCARYTPPVPVTQNFEDIDTSLPNAEQSDLLLWIPALLVSRFLAQFPFLKNESDELFSIGTLTVLETVDSGKYGGDKIGAICNVKCCRAMEDYINGLNSVVKVCTTTRYENLKKGIETPVHHPLCSNVGTEDDHSEIEVRDACDVLGYDVESLTLRQKRRVWEMLR
ncbi:MAG: hypothetical protein GY906_04820 [bacterium]|nr:hypothetical protein [bacterium]